MQKQIHNYITNFLSPYLCGYRKVYNTQQALVSLIEKWKKILDNKGFGGAVLRDLSKAFDTLNHELVSGYKHENIWARIGQVKIWESSKQKLLGVVIDRDLSFNEYVSSLCKKAGRKLSVLSRLSNLRNFQQRRLLMKSFVEAHFGYCRLVWMFHGREKK